jgi:hypothetical protein
MRMEYRFLVSSVLATTLPWLCWFTRKTIPRTFTGYVVVIVPHLSLSCKRNRPTRFSHDALPARVTVLAGGARCTRTARDTASLMVPVGSRACTTDRITSALCCLRADCGHPATPSSTGAEPANTGIAWTQPLVVSALFTYNPVESSQPDHGSSKLVHHWFIPLSIAAHDARDFPGGSPWNPK